VRSSIDNTQESPMSAINDLTTDLRNWAVTMEVKADEADAAAADLEARGNDPSNAKPGPG
jgi:hypothetical protein